MNQQPNSKARRVAAAVVLILTSFSIERAAAQSQFLGRTTDEWRERVGSDQPHVRAEAAWALSQYAAVNPRRNESFRLILLDNLVFHEDATVRYWIIQGLERLALSKESQEATRRAIQTSLRTSLSDKALAPRIASAQALGLLGDADTALPVLIEAMNHPQDAVRIQAVAALEKLGEAARPAEATLRAATSDPSEYVKRISTRALQKLDAAKP
jgi:HEAT repeat protein